MLTSLVLTAVLSLAGNQDTGSLAGVITDTSGRGLPGAILTVTSDDAEVRQATTDARGQYRFEALPPGRYRVKAGMNGFEARAGSLTIGSTTEAVWSGALLVGSPVGGGSIERRLVKVIGANARDCGRHDSTVSEAALQNSLQCARASALAKAPFSVVVQTSHEGHLAGFGLLGHVDGSMHVFRYYRGGLAFDSKPCPSSPSAVRAGPSGPPFAFECQP